MKRYMVTMMILNIVVSVLLLSGCGDDNLLDWGPYLHKPTQEQLGEGK